MRTPSLPSQHGLSMVELLVALAISSFLLLGITQIYLDNQRNSQFRQGLASNQEGSRFAALLLDEYLSKAGYRRTPDQMIEEAFPATTANSDCKAFALGSAVTSTASGIGICLRYQPLLSGEIDCQGDAITFNDSKPFKPAPLITLALRYTPNPAGDGDLRKGVLECKSLNATTPAYQELLSGIADLRLEFGVGKGDMLEKALGGERFVKASDWTSAKGPIRAVRYSILLVGAQGTRDGESAIYNNWQPTDSAAASRLSAGDKQYIYQVASGTQTLRNLMP